MSSALRNCVNPENMPDPIRRRFGYGQLWPLRPAFSHNRAGSYIYAGSDFPHQFQFRFSEEGMYHTVQNRPGSDLDGLARVWPNTSGLEASRCAGIIGSGFWHNATGPLPVSHFQTRFRSSTDVAASAAKPIRTGCESDPACLLGKVEVTVLGSPSPVVRTVSVEVKQH